MQSGAALARKPAPLQILHVGCGGEKLPPWLDGDEVTLDISPDHKPDIVASMLDMGDIGPFGGVYASHVLEHVYPHEVSVALGEMFRVLVPGGMVLLFVPDLEGIQPTEDVVYESPAGPITGLDMIYGHRPSLVAFPHMAHHTGFVQATLKTALESAGFANVDVMRVNGFNLLAKGHKP